MIRHSGSSVTSGDFAYVAGLAARNFVGDGPLSDAFRAALCTRLGRRHALLTGSGAAALSLALQALRQRHPRAIRVGVSAYVCPAVVSTIMRLGLEPVFFDLSENALNVDWAAAGAAVDERTLAVIATHTGGVPDDMTQAGRLGCPLISDCAQALGTRWGTDEVARLGMISVLSFGPTKVMTAGGGGAVLCDDLDLHEWLTAAATAEWRPEAYERSGFVATDGQHFSDVQAGLGLAQLDRLPVFLARRQAVAARYQEVLGQATAVLLPAITQFAIPNHFRWCFFSDDQAAWLALLRTGGVDARPSIAHDMTRYFPALRHLPAMRTLVPRVVSLPIHPAMSEADVDAVCALLEQGLKWGLP